MSSAAPLGILGGTFDPLHIAHLRLAIEARETLQLHAVKLIPAGAPALRDAPQAAAVHRLAMAQLAIAGEPQLSVDARELDVSGPSYTVDTLRSLRASLGDTLSLVLLIGADAFSRLEGWHCWRDLFSLAHLAVATRPGSTQKVGAGDTALDHEFRARQGDATDLAAAAAGRIVPFAITPLEISASLIRHRLQRGLSVRHLIPDAVLDYISLHQLYRTPHGH